MSELTTHTIKKTVEIKNIGPCTIEQWIPESALEIYQAMEIHNWAPWLAASPESLAGRAQVFPEGQLLLRGPNKELLASLSTNRVSWDGDESNLASWDEVAGDPTTYEKTFQQNGNALVLMSMNVNPEYKKNGLATTLAKEVQDLAHELGVEYLIGSFRPSEFGNYKAEKGNIPFEQYINMTRQADGLPIDAWIRSLTRNGMKPLKVDKHAMCITVGIQEFEEFKSIHKSECWKQISENTWECGEVGEWVINQEQDCATYIESNLWGILPGTPGYEAFMDHTI